MSKADHIRHFDPNGVGKVGSGPFGLPFSPEEAEVILLPVPWEVTVSYGAGTAKGPAAILQASPQIDLYDEGQKDAWQLGIATAPIPDHWQTENDRLRTLAKTYIDHLETGGTMHDPKWATTLSQINTGCARMMQEVEKAASHWLNHGKKVALVGGDHSTSLGLIRALATQHSSFGVLQIDAHADLREAYEGFTYSHASIMHNVLPLPQVSQLTQVGIRDYCEAEAKRIEEDPQISVFTDRELARHRFEGTATWAATTEQIISTLPEKVYISFDIDGLTPDLCPHTGTPVPGGLEFEQALYLIEAVAKSGREIIGVDVVEVAPGPAGNEWDANVGARLLYRLCNLMGFSTGNL